MNQVHHYLHKLSKIKRRHYHPLIHEIHKKHKISKKTLFYVKEYGPHTNITKTIIRESIKILLLASIISSFGGVAIENIKAIFISIMPLVIMLPALNDIIGGYGTIVSSKFSTLLHESKVKRKWWKETMIKKLFLQIFVIAMMAISTSVAISSLISYLSTGQISLLFTLKILVLVLLDASLLITLLFVTAILAGIYFYKKKEDPNNFLIPITTSIADFGNMLLLALLVTMFF